MRELRPFLTFGGWVGAAMLVASGPLAMLVITPMVEKAQRFAEMGMPSTAALAGPSVGLLTFLSALPVLGFVLLICGRGLRETSTDSAVYMPPSMVSQGGGTSGDFDRLGR
jgi:hypothetical protein